MKKRVPMLFRLFVLCACFVCSTIVRAQESEQSTHLNRGFNAGSIDSLIEQKQFAEAIILLNEEIRNLQGEEHRQEKGKLYFRQALIYQDINDFKNAMSSLVKAEELLEGQYDRRSMILVKLEMGDLFGKLGQCENAQRTLRNAYSLMLKNGMREQGLEIRNLQSIGISFGSCGDLDSALHYFEKARFVFEDTLNLGYCGLLNNIGAIYSKMQQDDKALSYYRRSLDLFKHIKSELGIHVTESNIAYIHARQGDFHVAIPLYERAVAYYENAGELLYLKDNLLNLSDAYEQVGDYARALKLLHQYQEINEQITNTDILTSISDLQTQHEIRKKENDLKLLTQKHALTMYRQGGLIAGIVVLFIVGFLVVRTLRANLINTRLKQEVLRQEKEQLKRDVDFKNKELEVFALKFIEKNELLERMKSEVKTIQSSDPEAGSKLKELSMVIHSNLSAEKDLKEFEIQLDKSHQSFFSKLNALHPELTENDKRLCSLLVLNLKTKDIAVILNISVDGVKKSRYRLRKKLGLTNEQNMTDYLLQL